MDDENYNLSGRYLKSPFKHPVPCYWINRKCVAKTNCSQKTGDTHVHAEGGVQFSVMLFGPTDFSLLV